MLIVCGLSLAVEKDRKEVNKSNRVHRSCKSARQARIGKCHSLMRSTPEEGLSYIYVGTECLCMTELCNGQPIVKAGESYPSSTGGKTNGSSGDDGKTGKSEGDEASERSVSVSFTVMSLVVTAAQFLRSL